MESNVPAQQTVIHHANVNAQMESVYVRNQKIQITINVHVKNPVVLVKNVIAIV